MLVFAPLLVACLHTSAPTPLSGAYVSVEHTAVVAERLAPFANLMFGTAAEGKAAPRRDAAPGPAIISKERSSTLLAAISPRAKQGVQPAVRGREQRMCKASSVLGH
jgi:hypothetical protein